MAVRIRMKKLGRRHRPFFRVCAVDSRAARDGRVIEYLGHYDPMVPETDARAVLNKERVDYWLSVGAQPSDKVAVLIKKYGSNGTHLDQQQAALDRLKSSKPTAPPPAAIPRKSEQQQKAEEGADESGEQAAESDAAVAVAEEGSENSTPEAAAAEEASQETKEASE